MKQLSTSLATHKIVIYNRENELEKETWVCADEAKKIAGQKSNKDVVIVGGSTYEHWQVQIVNPNEKEKKKLRENFWDYIDERIAGKGLVEKRTIRRFSNGKEEVIKTETIKKCYSD
jgi:hypothetical protein